LNSSNIQLRDGISPKPVEQDQQQELTEIGFIMLNTILLLYTMFLNIEGLVIVWYNHAGSRVLVNIIFNSRKKKGFVIG
jgi:hypothetical protein